MMGNPIGGVFYIGVILLFIVPAVLFVWEYSPSPKRVVRKYNRLKFRWPFPKRAPKTIVVAAPVKTVPDRVDTVMDHAECDLWDFVHSRKACSATGEVCEGGP